MKKIKFKRFGIFFYIDFEGRELNLAYFPIARKPFLFVVIIFKPRFGLNLFNHSIINPYRN